VVIRIAKEQVAAYDEVELRKNVWQSLIMPSGAETYDRSRLAGSVKIKNNVNVII
jgi:hypothetical protein